MTRSFTLAAINRAAKSRPSGYVEDVLSRGTVDGDLVTLTDEAYALLVAKYRGASAVVPKSIKERPLPPTSGPGTELKKLLSKIGITTKPGCQCNQRARVMDEKGADWCAENLSTIVGWLKEEHARQKILIPFSETAVSLLVKYAIRRARAIAK